MKFRTIINSDEICEKILSLKFIQKSDQFRNSIFLKEKQIYRKTEKKTYKPHVSDESILVVSPVHG